MSPDEAVVWAARAKKAGDEAVVLDKIHEFVLTRTHGRFIIENLKEMVGLAAQLWRSAIKSRGFQEAWLRLTRRFLSFVLRALFMMRRTAMIPATEATADMIERNCDL
jgi:hypothetical protein